MPDRRTRSRKTVARPTKTKRCASCLETKRLDDFGDNPRMRLGKKSYCRECSNRLQREWNRDQRGQSEKKRRAKKRLGVRKPRRGKASAKVA